MELYQPERYPVLTQKGGVTPSSEGLCTCWTAPELLVRTRPQLLERYALIGSLYSREGVSILLRNLLLNPCITAVRVLADNPFKL